MAERREIDQPTGVEKVGHEWDGIEELDNPLPKWWVWCFYVTIAWAVAYMIAMPAVPLVSSYTKGLLGHSQRAAVAEDLERARTARAPLLAKLAAQDLEAIAADPDLLAFAMAGGKSLFAVNCSQCHGSGAQGAVGYPNLNDDDWLWGGTLEDIETTIRFGIRAAHEDTRDNAMPAFLKDGILGVAEIADVSAHVLTLAGRDADAGAASRGAAIYAEQCAACHGGRGQGNRELGAPNLGDAIWLYGGDEAAIRDSIAYSRNGVMPAFAGKLDEATIRQLAIYVHRLGGGQ